MHCGDPKDVERPVFNAPSNLEVLAPLCVLHPLRFCLLYVVRGPNNRSIVNNPANGPPSTLPL